MKNDRVMAICETVAELPVTMLATPIPPRDPDDDDVDEEEDDAERVRKADKRVRIFTRRGFDETSKYPVIGEAMRKLRVTSVTSNGEGVLLRSRRR